MTDLLPTIELPTRATLEDAVRSNQAAAREWVLALLQLHDRKLYRETHPSWDAYVLDTFGYSHSTATRWLAQGREILALEAGSEDIAAGQDRPRAAGLPSQRQAANAQKARRKPIPADSTEVADTASEGAGIQLPAEPTDGPTLPSLSAPSGPNPTGPVPSLRQEASAAHRALREATEGIGAKWTIEEATYWQNRTEREMAAWRKANKIDQPKPERRQGTVTRPQAEVLAGRAITAPPYGSLTRREVQTMFKGKS